jgi:hypothetical protein
MQNTFFTSRDRRSVDFTPLKILFAALAISLVGVLTDVSAMTPLQIVFRPPLSKIKQDLRYCSVDTLNNICGHERPIETPCFPSENRVLSGSELCPVSNGLTKPSLPSGSAKVRKKGS